MEDAHYFRAKAERCLRIANLLSDRQAAENLRAVAADAFATAVNMEAAVGAKMNVRPLSPSGFRKRPNIRKTEPLGTLFARLAASVR